MYRKSIYTKERIVVLKAFYENKVLWLYRKTGENREKLGKELWPVRCITTSQFFVVSATIPVVAHIISLLILSLFWKVYGCGELQGFPQPLFLVRQYFFRQGKNGK